MIKSENVQSGGMTNMRTGVVCYLYGSFLIKIYMYYMQFKEYDKKR